MRGHIKQRAKGSWSIVLELGRDPATGKRRQQWTTFRGTKRDAKRKLAELQHQMDTGSYLKPLQATGSRVPPTVAERLRLAQRDPQDGGGL